MWKSLIPSSARRSELFALVGILALPSLGAAQSPLGPFGPNSVNWPVAAGGNGHIYEPVAVPGGVTWSAANHAALAAGGHLATIATAAENLFVFGLVSAAPAFWQSSTAEGPWLGGHQKPGSLEPDGGWTWVTSEPFTYTNWRIASGTCSGEPNNSVCTGGFEEDCLSFIGCPPTVFPLSSTFAQWNDRNGDAATCTAGEPRAYVVEYDVELRCPCTPTGLAAANLPPNNVCAAGAFTLCVARISTGAARLQVFNLPAGTIHGKVLISALPAFPVGSGPFFGLNFDPSLFIPILLAPYAVGDPLSWVVADPGFSPEQPFFVPPGTTIPFAGQTWDFVALAVTPGGYVLSNYIQTTWP